MKVPTKAGTRICGSKLKARLVKMTAICNTISHGWLVRSLGGEIGFIVIAYVTTAPFHTAHSGGRCMPKPRSSLPRKAAFGRLLPADTNVFTARVLAGVYRHGMGGD